MRSRRATRDFPGTIPGGSSVYHLVTISGCHGDEGDREVTRPLVLLRYLSCRRRLSAHEGVRSIGRSIGRSSHSHAGLHRGSIRFSPARQYPFFPRTVRGTNCSCISFPLSPFAAPSPYYPLRPLPLPVVRAAQESQTQRLSFSFGCPRPRPRPPPAAAAADLSLSRGRILRGRSPPRPSLPSLPTALLAFGVRPVQMYGDAMLYIID